jgi:hypothetical protein
MSEQTVFLAWQDKAQTRLWFPVGRLDLAPDGSCTFKYVRGAKNAEEKVGFKSLLAFPDFERVYQSAGLFPMFQNRVMNRNRDDFSEYLEQMDLSGNPSALDILSVDGGQRETDHCEVFPLLECDNDGRFSCRFFLHGWRHVAECSQKRLAECVREGDSLQVALELTNPKTKIGLQVQTMDYCMIGWAPRYLAHDLSAALRQCDEKPENPEIKVVKVNRDAPMHQRYLIEFKGRFNNYRPMQSDEFKPLVAL